MKLPLVLFLTALASRQIQAWERSAIDSKKPGACLHTSYTGTLHEPDEDGEDRCVGTFRGTNFFEHNCRHHSGDCWQSFAQKCKEILGGIIQMVSQSCRSERSRSTVDIDMKSRVINDGNCCTKTPEIPKLVTEECIRPVRPVQPVCPVPVVQETIVRTEPEYRYPDFHHHHHPHHHPHHHHHHHLQKHYEKMAEKEEKHEEKALRKALHKMEKEERHREKEERHREKEERYRDMEERYRDVEDDCNDRDIEDRDRVADDEIVRAAVVDKEEGIKLLEKQIRQLEGLETEVDRTF